MSVGDRWWNPNPAPAADTGTADTGAATAKPTVQDLGNGYSLVQFTDENGMAKSQIVPNKDAASVAAVEAAKIGAGAAGVSASISANAANQRAAVQAEIDRAKNASDAAHSAAVLALQQGNAAEARRQFDISSQELARSHQADEQLRQQSQHLEASKFGNDVYNKLAELASNPRNYMEQLFRFRGQTPPANSAQYGNTSVTGPGLMTFDQFLPNFLKTLGLSPGMPVATATSNPSTSTVAASAPAATQTGSAAQAGAGGLASSPGMQQQLIKAALAGANASPQSYASNNLTIPGTGPVIGPPNTGAPFAGPSGQSPVYSASGQLPGNFDWSNHAQPGSEVERGQLNRDQADRTQAFAGGGTLRMTAPHAIVNLLSGKVAAIAGEQPGRGPQGFVPETAKFNGKAIVDPNADPSKIGQPGDPINSFLPPDAPTPAYDTAPMPTLPYESPAAPLQTSNPRPAPPSISLADQQRLIAGTGAGVHPATDPVSMPTLPSGTTAPASDRTVPPLGLTQPDRSTVPTGQTPPLDINPPSGGGPVAMPTLPTAPGSPAADRTVPALGAPSTGQSPTTFQDMNPTLGAPTPGMTSGRTMPGLTPMPPSFSDMNPTFGSAAGTTSGDPSRVLPPLNSWGGPLYSTPSGIGNNPTFLPENPQNDPIVDAMLKSGSFPPFLQRVFAQQLGLPGLGTNVPQQANLPPGVPLISQLALNQMSPSEFQAFQSFLSAHGIDWNDYIAMVQDASPQGGRSSATNPNISFLPQNYK